MRKILVLLMIGLLAACAKGGGRATCPQGWKCLEAGNAADPLTLDPNKSQTVWEANILYELLVPLTYWSADGHVIPGMATHWDVSPDGLTWTFHLRDAKWSDGVPVTAHDFVYSLQRIENPMTASPYAYLLYIISGAQAVNEGKAKPETIGAVALDDRTLQLHLTHPAPYLPLLLVHSSAMPIPEHVVKKWGDAWVQPGHFVSNGPYKLVSSELGERTVLVRNPYYWNNGKTCFDRVDFYPTTDAVTAERRVESGEFDVNYNFASSRADYLRKKLPGYVHTSPYLANWYLSMNEQDPVLKDKRIRLALSLGIDRDFVATKLSRAGTRPLYMFVPPGMADYKSNPPPTWSKWTFAQRQDYARKLLAQAGYGPDHPLRLEYKFQSNGGTSAAALQADWHNIGIDISLTPEESQIFYSDLNAGNFQIAWDGWAMDYDDPMTFLELLDSRAGAQNHSRYDNPRFDALIDQANDERDLAKRAKLLADAETIAVNDVAVAPIMTDSTRYLVNPDITGWVDNPANVHLKSYLCRKGPPPE